MSCRSRGPLESFSSCIATGGEEGPIDQGGVGHARLGPQRLRPGLPPRLCCVEWVLMRRPAVRKGRWRREQAQCRARGGRESVLTHIEVQRLGVRVCVCVCAPGENRDSSHELCACTGSVGEPRPKSELRLCSWKDKCPEAPLLLWPRLQTPPLLVARHLEQGHHSSCRMRWVRTRRSAVAHAALLNKFTGLIGKRYEELHQGLGAAPLPPRFRSHMQHLEVAHSVALYVAIQSQRPRPTRPNLCRCTRPLPWSRDVGRFEAPLPVGHPERGWRGPSCSTMPWRDLRCGGPHRARVARR